MAVFPDHAGGASDLFLAADLAMHQAKRRGGGRVRLHDPSDRERDRTGRLREQSNRIRASLAESRFVPYFQPVAEVGSGRIVAVETLARMREPDGRITLPAEFLGAAERFGIVTAIDRAIIAAAFDGLAVSPNASAPSSRSASTSRARTSTTMRSSPTSRGWLGPRASGPSASRSRSPRPQPCAISTACGTSRSRSPERASTSRSTTSAWVSSFRYLRELPVSSLKLDISYVKDLPKEKANRVFVRGMASICRGLGVKTVAEGVESKEVMDILPELGVDRAQGWHVGFPEPALPLPVVDVDSSQPLPRRTGTCRGAMGIARRCAA